MVPPGAFGTTSNAFFSPGEPIAFCFDTAPLASAAPTSSAFRICWRRRGDDGRTEEGVLPLSAGASGVVTTRLDVPGFVQLAVTPLDDAGDEIAIPGFGRPPYRFGAGASPDGIEAPAEPADFDDFWNRQKARLAKEPLVADKVFLGVTNGMSLFSVRAGCPGNVRPMTGYLAIPDGACQGCLPARVCFQGYGTFPQAPEPGLWEEGWIVLEINAHGFEIGREEAYYDEFFQSLRDEQGGEYAFDPARNADPTTAYFYGMALRALRALELVKALPEWNREVLEVKGESQGGLQACWAAGLDPDVTQVRVGSVWCCDLAGSACPGRLAGRAPDFTPALGYYDPVFHARRFRAKKFRVFRAALGDEVCPPAGLALLYRNAAVRDKRIDWVQGTSHEPEPGALRQVFRWKGAGTSRVEYRIDDVP